MQRFDPDLPIRLIEILPEAYRHISYEEKYEWRDPPAGFFTKGGYLTIPSPDRLSPTWVQVPLSSNDPWDQTRTAFERFGTVENIMTPTLTIHRTDGQQQREQTTNTPSTGGTMGVAALLSEQTPPEQEHLEEEAFLEGEVPREEEVPRAAAAIQQAAQEAIQEDRQAEEAHQVEEAHQEEEATRAEEASQEARQEEAPTTHNRPGEIA
ncbi:hypothetical protein WOLCODRAFT_156150 [Wolfiporia cocos MD-104 SS10]|uniref:Uncharacterized protein n=1 Tax=Wolfiporia cocos (strain MD-104) TaxID=742152 RepID=A0A2H3JHH6_WOLCO|nr:hypothetical protein WOLCODRAFT_156150 [Wolfiporia cocos MD-104 SS10]